MATFTVLKFDSAYGADDALHTLQSLQRDQLIEVLDAAVVSWPEDENKPKTRQLQNMAGAGALGGAFWGFLFGLIFFVPLLGLAIGAGMGALAGSMADVGIDDDMIRQIRKQVTPGTSALFVLSQNAVLDRVAERFQSQKGRVEVLQTNLSQDQEAILREIFGEEASTPDASSEGSAQVLGGAPAEAVVATSAVVEARPAVPESTAVVAAEALAPLESEFRYLFDDTTNTIEHWRFVGGGSFAVVDGALEAQPGEDFGVLYYAAETFSDFDLRLDFRLDRIDSDSGVFVRFRDPLKPVPDRVDPAIAHPYDKQQWVAVNTGFEVQIDEFARGSAEKPDEHRTGAIYDIPIGPELGQQQYERGSVLTPDTWHRLEIVVRDNTYRVNLDGMVSTTFTNTDPLRGQPPRPEVSSGYIGLQSFLGRVAFRNVRIRTP